MKSLIPQGGYTIIEVMMFLAVSAGLFTAAIGTFSEQNRRTEFYQSIRDVETKLQDVFNDVDTGFFPSSGSLTCRAVRPGEPTITPGGNQQGSNEDCIFVGKALRFTSEAIEIYTMVGRRIQDGSNDPATTIQQSVPALYTDIFDSLSLQSDVEVTSVEVNGVGSTGGLVVLTGFGSTDTSGSIASSLAYLPGTNVDLNRAVLSAGIKNPAIASSSVVICFQENGTGGGRRGAIRIGRDSQKFGMETLTEENQVNALGVCP